MEGGHGHGVGGLAGVTSWLWWWWPGMCGVEEVVEVIVWGHIWQSEAILVRDSFWKIFFISILSNFENPK